MKPGFFRIDTTTIAATPTRRKQKTLLEVAQKALYNARLYSSTQCPNKNICTCAHDLFLFCFTNKSELAYGGHRKRRLPASGSFSTVRWHWLDWRPHKADPYGRGVSFRRRQGSIRESRRFAEVALFVLNSFKLKRY